MPLNYSLLYGQRTLVTEQISFILYINDLLKNFKKLLFCFSVKFVKSVILPFCPINFSFSNVHLKKKTEFNPINTGDHHHSVCKSCLMSIISL